MHRDVNVCYGENNYTPLDDLYWERIEDYKQTWAFYLLLWPCGGVFDNGGVVEEPALFIHEVFHLVHAFHEADPVVAKMFEIHNWKITYKDDAQRKKNKVNVLRYPIINEPATGEILARTTPDCSKKEISKQTSSFSSTNTIAGIRKKINEQEVWIKTMRTYMMYIIKAAKTEKENQQWHNKSD